eukprot:Em0001g3223a
MKIEDCSLPYDDDEIPSVRTQVAIRDETSIPGVMTIRHSSCPLLFPHDSRAVRCSKCSTYRSVLKLQCWKAEHSCTNDAGTITHVNCRYMKIPELIQRLQQVNSSYRSIQKRFNHLKEKIAAETKLKEVSLDEESEAYVREVASSSDAVDYLAQLPQDSFMHIFWQQQLKAASKCKATGKRWHPLFIRWCSYLRHRSSGAYEVLRESGIQLPSQQTLLDNTHYVQADVGFSSDVDAMLMDAVKVGSCAEREWCVILMMDEMHIKDTGRFIGYTNLGNVTDKLSEFERFVEERHGQTSPPSGKKHNGFHGSGSIHQAPISLCSVSSNVCLWRSIVRTILGGNWTFGKLWVKAILCLYQWLETEFLGYLDEWKSCVEQRPGFSKNQKSRILLSDG